MNLTSYIFGIIAAVVTLFVVVEMLRRRRLRERHIVWWLLFGVLVLVVAVFPSALAWAAGLVGITVPINLVFFVSVIVLFLVSLQHSAEATRLENKTRILAEEHAILALRVAELQARSESGGSTDGDD
jgi:hypothetical protein